MKPIKSLKPDRFFIFLVWAAILVVSVHITDPAIAAQTKTTGTSMDTHNKLPPIDTAAPSTFETISFGLG